MNGFLRNQSWHARCKPLSAMSVASALQLVRVVGALLAMSLSATTVHADPPRPDALKMRNAPRASTALAPSQPSAATPASVQPTPAQPAVTSHVDSATAANTLKEASEALELCYSLARRADASLGKAVTVHATVRADASVELRAHAASLGNGYFARCVERKVGALVTVSQLPEATADTRTIMLGAKTPSAH
jgi:hypothetical protein